jgi:hypothetical protein
VIADADAVRREVELLWEFHGRRLRPGTPAEHLADRVAFSHAPPLRVVECRGCGLVFRNPRERAHELRAMYASGDAAPPDEVLRALHETQRPMYDAPERRLREVLGRAGSVLEVGSYVGAFLGAARDRGWSVEGLDVNEPVNAFVRSLGFRVTTGALSAVAPGRRYDAVAVWNTFDQLPDPGEAALRARALLAEGGVLAVRVPNGAFYARLRPLLDSPLRTAAVALLAHANLLTFPYRHGFTPRSLERLLGRVGLHVVRVVGDALVPIADRWTRPWAAIEERAVKAGTRLAVRVLPRDAAPWIEVYARVS